MDKRVTAVGLCLLLAGGAAFAGGAQEKAGPTGPGSAVTGKLSIWLGYGETLSAYQNAQSIFEGQYPNVQVEILTFALREFEAKLATSMPTGSGPDLLTFHDFIFPRYYEGGNYAPMPDDLVKIVNDPAKINPVFAQTVSRDGKPWGVPIWTGRSALFYNKDHLAAAGLSGPPDTVDQLWQWAEKLVKKDAAGTLSRAGLTMRLTGPSGGIQKFGYLYFQMAGQQIFERGKEVGTVRITIDDNIDVATKALLDRINHLHGARKVDDWALKHDAQAFASGVASMLLRETWVISFTEQNGPDINFGTALMPKGKVRGAFNYFETLLVNKDSKLKNPTWDFVRTMITKDVMDVILQDSGYIPLRRDYDYSAILANKPHHKAVMEAPKDYIQYIEAPNTAYEEMTTKTGEVVQEAYRDASLVNNAAGARKVMLKTRDTAAQILGDAGIYSE